MLVFQWCCWRSIWQKMLPIRKHASVKLRQKWEDAGLLAPALSRFSIIFLWFTISFTAWEVYKCYVVPLLDFFSFCKWLISNWITAMQFSNGHFKWAGLICCYLLLVLCAVHLLLLSWVNTKHFHFLSHYNHLMHVSRKRRLLNGRMLGLMRSWLLKLTVS